jgi:hypothetical protein
MGPASGARPECHFDAGAKKIPPRRDAFRRRAAGEKLTFLARDLGINANYLIKVLRGELRPDLFIELGPSLSSAYFSPERLAEAKARQARKTALLLVEREKRGKREAKRAACEKRRTERLARRVERRAQRGLQLRREIPAEKRIIDEEAVARLIFEWQKTGDSRLFEKITAASLKLIHYALGHYRFLRHEESEEDELVNEMVLEFNRVLPRFNPTREVFPFSSIPCVTI